MTAFQLCKKHKHTKGTRVIFCELKAPGGSNTQWTLSSFDKVNPTSLFGYNVERKEKNKSVSP